MCRIDLAAFTVAVLISACSCHSLPLWSGEVEVSPIEREAIEACGNGALTTDGAKMIHRHPFLQRINTDRANVVWASWPPDVKVVVTTTEQEVVDVTGARYAGDPEKRERRAKRLRERDKVYLKPDDYYPLRAELQDLEPGTLYCYHLARGEIPLTEPAPLLTAPAPDTDKPIRFVVLGDTGTGGAAQAAIARRLSETPFDFMVFLGDVAYGSGTPAQIQTRFFEVYRDYIRFAPVYPAIGNHERRTDWGDPFLEAFVLPEEESYYSFDWGDIHFIAFDTTDFSSAQREWLEQDLASNKRAWTIAYGHHPLYSNSFRGPQRRIRGRFEPLFRRHGVDLVLSGHEHHYERFRPIGGVVYVVSGGGGGRLTRIYNNTLAVKQAAVHHYLSFEVTREKLTMVAIDIEGEEIDRLEMRAR